MPHVTFIHGISNKPPQDKLLEIWLATLEGSSRAGDEGIDLGAIGITSSLVYWADVLYDQPLKDQALESAGDLESNEAVAARQGEDVDMSWRENLGGEEKEVVDGLAVKLSFDALVNDTFTPPASGADKQLERIPIPWFIKRRLMKEFLRDVHHYLFNYKFSPRTGVEYLVQDEIRDRMLAALREGASKPGPHIVVSHSMGTVIAYDCLKRVAGCPKIDGFMTVGSPLGIDEVQDKLKPEWTREDGFPSEKLAGHWINVYDKLDPVTGFDGDIDNDFKQQGNAVVEVINEQNWGDWRHSITKYLVGEQLRKGLLKLLGEE
jgi:predicted alpha/beta hydrolase family esterase